MRGRTVRTITATALAGIMLVAGTGCGSAKANVIEQAKEKCGIQSNRGQKIEYAYSQDEGYGDVNTLNCLTNLMPDSIYKHYEADQKKAAVYYDVNHEPLSAGWDEDGYRWRWRMLFNTQYGPIDETILRIEKL